MEPFSRYLPTLEAYLQRIVHRDASPLYGMLAYHLGWVDEAFRPLAEPKRGKRLRPVLLLLVSEAQGGDWREALPAAAAVELLHNFSLIHDDIEDGDRMRRGRPTLWTLWGEAQAINAGDTLYTLACESLLALPDALVPEALHHFTEAARMLTEGQHLDMAFERMEAVDEVTYLRMVAGKTAALIALSAWLGGLCAGANAATLTALERFGHNVGMSFQMQDDILGLWGDPRRTGKPVGNDLRQRKKTLPIIHGMAHSEAFRRLLARPHLDDEAVAQAQALLEATGSRAYVEARAADYLRQGLEALEEAGGSGEAKEALHTLVQRLLGRDQ